jgi:hypothetical protein
VRVFFLGLSISCNNGKKHLPYADYKCFFSKFNPLLSYDNFQHITELQMTSVLICSVLQIGTNISVQSTIGHD